MVPQLLIAAPRVVPGTGPPGVLEPGYVLVTGGRVAEVAAGPPPRSPDLVLGSGCIVPGLIDLQVNVTVTPRPDRWLGAWMRARGWSRTCSTRNGRRITASPAWSGGRSLTRG
jgi:imidazolonepropionase-like amidohydrolase